MYILLVDDHTLFREALLHVLKQLDTQVLVLEAASIDEATCIMVHSHNLDLILLDIDLPYRNGLAALPDLRALLPTVPIVVLSGSENVQHVQQALHHGAVGYLPKSCSSHEMLAALRMVLQGDIYLPLKLMSKLDSLANSLEPQVTPTMFTARQIEVLHLMAQGLPNKAIAKQLQIAEGTIKLHVAAILQILGVCNRTQAVTKALQLALIPESNEQIQSLN